MMVGGLRRRRGIGVMRAGVKGLVYCPRLERLHRARMLITFKTNQISTSQSRSCRSRGLKCARAVEIGSLIAPAL